MGPQTFLVVQNHPQQPAFFPPQQQVVYVAGPAPQFPAMNMHPQPFAQQMIRMPPQQPMGVKHCYNTGRLFTYQEYLSKPRKTTKKAAQMARSDAAKSPPKGKRILTIEEPKDEAPQSSVVAESQATSVDVESQAACVVAESQATNVDVESQATSVVAESQATSVDVESQATSVVAESQATSVVVESQATSVVAESQATSVVVESQPTSVVAESQATSVVVEFQPISVVAESQATSVVVESQATSVVVESQPTSVVAESQATSVVPESQTTSVVAESQTTNVVPESQTTSVVPESQTTSVVPESQTTSVVTDEPPNFSAEYERLRRVRTSLKPGSCVYSAEFVNCVRDFIYKAKNVQCLLTEKELIEYGLDKKSAPPPLMRESNRQDFKRGQKEPSRSTSKGHGRTSRGPKPPNRPVEPVPVIERTITRSAVMAPSHRAEKAWKPKAKEADIDKITKTAKEIRGLLNKITPTTYKDLLQKFLDYKCYEEEDVRNSIVDVIFEKAVEEPRFCPLYSDLCYEQLSAERKAKGKTGGDSSFRANILRRAQKTFERTEDSKLDNLQKQLAEEEEEAKKKNLQDKITELKAKEKRRIHGNIAFIGELFRHGIVSQSIVNWCVVSLIKETETVKPDDASIECAVKMLTSVGKVWDAQTVVEEKKSAWGNSAAGSSEAQPKQNALMAILRHLKQISGTKQYAPRTRFMIVDLLDLKKNNWIPRNSAEKGPKTKQEIADEVKREECLKEMQRYNWERQDRMASTKDTPAVRTILRRRV